MQFWYGIFVKVCNMSITASIVMIAVLVLRLLLRKAPKRFSYMLWGIVLFRLLCPVSLPSVYSVLNLVKVPVLTNNSTQINSATLDGNSALMDNFALSDSAALVDSVTLTENTNVYSDKTPYLLAGILGTVSLEKIISGLVFIWILGIIVLCAYSVVSLIRLHRQIGCSMPLRDNIYLTDYISSPFVLGVLRPRIYLPSALSDKEQEYIILHEQYHIHRRDYLLKMLAFVALCLHWFNPLMYLAFILAGKDMEMSCDEAVMQKMNGDIRSEYAESLLKFAVGRRKLAGMPLAFGEENPKSRIKNVMNYKKPAFWVIIIAIIVCVLGGVSLLTNPMEKRATMEWAKALQVDDINRIELVVFPQDIEKQYKDFSAEAFEDVVALIKQSRGKYLSRHEDVEGSSIFFYVTMTDGRKHEVGNIGNYYLVIDGDYYDAGYDWLSSWDRAYGEGNAALPAGFFGIDYDASLAVSFQAEVLEVNEKTLRVRPLEGYFELDSSDLFVVSLEGLAISSQIDVGAIVEISYDGTIMESYPAQLGKVYQIFVLDERKEVEENNSVVPMSEEEAIVNAIMEYNLSKYPYGYDFACCSFLNLETLSATPVVGSTEHVITYYGWMMYMTCNFSEKGIVQESGAHVPIALTFLLDENGYTLQEYWEPRDGSYYASDILEKFPAHIVEELMKESDSRKYVVQQMQDCYKQAIVYKQLDTNVIIENLLHEICFNTSIISSNPQDYIDAHYLEYRELCYYGDFTVSYCLSRFERGNETGLEGHIMARLCEDLLKPKIPADTKIVSTGQEWYDALKAHANNIVEKYTQ